MSNRDRKFTYIRGGCEVERLHEGLGDNAMWAVALGGLFMGGCVVPRDDHQHSSVGGLCVYGAVG